MRERPEEAMELELQQARQDRADLAFAIRQGDLERAQAVLDEIDRRMGWA